MNTQEISDLLSKYYRGESTDEEEILLRDFFNRTEVPPELEDEREIFSFYRAAGKIPAPSLGFEKRIISVIDDHEKVYPVAGIRRKLYIALSSAAALLILIGFWFLYVREPEPSDTFSDPAIAYAETIKVLYSVSYGLNNGMGALEPVRRMESAATESLGTLTKSTDMIGNKLRSLEYFSKAMNIISSPLDISTNKKK